VVMDDLSAHNSKRIKELIEQRGCELWYISAVLLSGVQPHRRSLRQDQEPALRKAAARSKEALIEAIEQRRYLRSVPKTSEVTFNMRDTVLQVNYCETCCRVYESGSVHHVALS
jgi:hypothetical protein